MLGSKRKFSCQNERRNQHVARNSLQPAFKVYLMVHDTAIGLWYPFCEEWWPAICHFIDTCADAPPVNFRTICARAVRRWIRLDCSAYAGRIIRIRLLV